MTLPWQAALVIYRVLDVRLDLGEKHRDEFQHELSNQEVEDAVRSFRACARLVEELSLGETAMAQQVVVADHPLRTLSPLAGGNFWPSPDDTREDFRLCGADTPCDSFFVFWPQRDPENKHSVPSAGWGLGMGPDPSWRGMTYASVANAPTLAWDVPRLGEVWLHEWLHGVSAVFRALGCSLPDGDADGGGRHGYVQSPVTGWCAYYRDLMTCRVEEQGVRKGISAADWRAWSQSRQ